MKLIVKDFCLRDTVLSGQAFRIIEESDSSFTIVLKDRVVNVKQEDEILYVESSNEDNLEKILIEYFDLNRNYDVINNRLSADDKRMMEIVSKCKGYRIMNQDPFEMCISYIISQNNNVKRISNTIEKICSKYGEKVVFKDKEYYLFPKFEVLKNINVLEYRNFGCGFRDKYLFDFFRVFNNMNSINDLSKLSSLEALNELTKVKGIGLKVASCILLFGFKRFDVFPIDTWVKQTISKLYKIDDSQKEIEEFTKKKFGKYSALAIQYMYHYGRNK